MRNKDIPPAIAIYSFPSFKLLALSCIHVPPELEWFDEPDEQADHPEGLERRESTWQLLLEQVDRETGAMGFSRFHIFWTYNLL